MRSGGLFLVVGDSTTYNTVATGNGMKLYAHVIAAQIRSTYGMIRHVNLGMSGSNTSDYVADMPIFGGFTEPDLVCIGYGMNDCVTSGITTTVYSNNLTAIVNRFRQMNPNVHVILCTPNTIGNGGSVGTRTEAILQPYRDAMAAVAASFTSGVDVCRFETAWTPANAGTNTADQMHPNETGHGLIANVLWPVVQKGSWLQRLGKTS